MKEIHMLFKEQNVPNYKYTKNKKVIDCIDTTIYSNKWFRLPSQSKESVIGTEHVIIKGFMEDFIVEYIPSYSKNIDEIKAMLGTPADDTEPTKLQLEEGIDEWEKTFIKNGNELLVTYNPITREVKDFFIQTKDPSGKTQDISTLMQVANVEENPAANYEVIPSTVIGDNSYFTGIRIQFASDAVKKLH